MLVHRIIFALISCFSALLLHLLHPLDPRPRIRQSLGETNLLRQSGCFLILLPRLTNLTLHLEELAEVMCRNRTAHIALLALLWRLDSRCLR
jgi:hypothetical protein